MIRSRFVAGADGGRSSVVHQLGLPMAEGQDGGIAFNIHVEADLSHLMQNSVGFIHMLVQPEREIVPWAMTCGARCVQPWHEWLFVLIPVQGIKEVNATEADWVRRIRDFIGDASVDVKVKGVSKWRVNECFAKEYRKGNVLSIV